LPEKWVEIRRKRGFALLDWLSGRETNPNTSKQPSSPAVPDSSSSLQSKRLRKGKKAVFLAKDKEIVERILLEAIKKKEPEEQKAKPLSDVERLAMEAEVPRSPLRGRLMTEAAEEVGLTEGAEPASPDFNPSPDPSFPPDLLLSPSDPLQFLSTKASPAKSDQNLFFPAVSPQAQPKAYRRLIEIPAFPFGKHKPIPQKVEIVILDTVELKIRRKRAKLRKMLGEISAEVV
jgi:hypothetical protein